MTAPEKSAPAVHLLATNPENGCTSCGTQHTVQLHPHRGRLCSDHITLPPGGFQADLAADMVEIGRADAAFAYLRAFLVVECARRFGVVVLP